MSQTLNTASPATGLNVAQNVTTGDIGIANSQTSGGLDIGTFGSRSGQITIGSDGSTAQLRLDAGTGGIYANTVGAGDITLKTGTGGTCKVDAAAAGTVLIGDTVTTGNVTIGSNVTDGAITIGGITSATGSISIGPGSLASSTITLGGSSSVADINLDSTGIITIGGNGEGTVYIGEGAGETGNVYIGGGAGSVGVTIDSGSTDAVDIGYTGATTIGNNASGTAAITIGHATASGNIEVLTTGNHNITAGKVRVLDTSQATSLTNGSAEYKGGIGVTKNIVIGENIILGEDLRSDVLTRNVAVFPGNTTGDVSIGGLMTTADINLGAAGQTGKIKVLSTAETITSTGGAFTCAGGASIEKRLIVGNGVQYGTLVNQVTQLTSNTTTVVLNTPYGFIHNFGANIPSHTSASFTFINTTINSGSIIHVSVNGFSGAGMPIVMVMSITTGSCVVQISNGQNSNITNSVTIAFSVH